MYKYVLVDERWFTCSIVQRSIILVSRIFQIQAIPLVENIFRVILPKFSGLIYPKAYIVCLRPLPHFLPLFLLAKNSNSYFL